jgi:hypothetical protein
VIIMLNGAFGVGKTTAAEILAAALTDAMVFDPEVVGSMVRRVTEGVRHGCEDTDDYQDIAMWRVLTVATAEQLRARYRRTLIVPMTLATPAYYREIRGGLARVDPDVRHFCLVAPLETVQERLRGRGDGAGSWPWRRAARCVRALDVPEYAEHIDTEGREPADVAGMILARLEHAGAGSLAGRRRG